MACAPQRLLSKKPAVAGAGGNESLGGSGGRHGVGDEAQASAGLFGGGDELQVVKHRAKVTASSQVKGRMTIGAQPCCGSGGRADLQMRDSGLKFCGFIGVLHVFVSNLGFL